MFHEDRMPQPNRDRLRRVVSGDDERADAGNRANRRTNASSGAIEDRGIGEGGPETVAAPGGANAVCVACGTWPLNAGQTCGSCSHTWSEAEGLVMRRTTSPGFALVREALSRATEGAIGRELAGVALRTPGASMARVTVLQAQLARLVTR
jgi:hypothetical protein